MSHPTDLPNRPVTSQYTDGQWQAIYDTGDNILVSASAGSGKTTVLVERVIEKIKAGSNVDELLIVTYTEAAAKEMKQRIQTELQKAISAEGQEEEKRHLVAQLPLLPTAHISTLHAFCLQVIRRYYYLIQIDPVFRLLTDETEMLLLKEDVWDELREELYGDENIAFYQLTANFSNDRSDQGLTDVIYSLYDFARSNPNPQAWLRDLAKLYEVGDDLAQAAIYQEYLKPTLIAESQLIVKQTQEMVALVEGHERFEKVHQLALVEMQLSAQFHELLLADQLGDLYDFLATSYQFARYPGLRNLEPEEAEVNNHVKALRDQNKTIVTNWKKGIFSIHPVQMSEVMIDAQVLVRQMAEVASKFEAAYTSRKAEKKLVDFNDLEHFTLRILANFDSDHWVETEASTYYRAKFSEVLVDEYQDINQLQENILYWLRNPIDKQGNLFMVGDVKQSIYSFRLADPSLFIDKYEAYETHAGGRRIILAENFRSRGEVLDFTNLVFSQLMNPTLGQLSYDQSASLVTGFKGYPASEKFSTEVLIFESKNDSPEEVEEVVDLTDDFQIDDKTEGELRLVGHKIKELIASEFPVYDKKEKQSRPITYGDIVLLSPTKKNNLVLLDIFKELEIPLRVNDTQNYFQATEIRIMVALLNVIDNPYQDIPLAAVLRSPIVGIGENDLATIRTSLAKGNFYDALLEYVETEHTQSQLKEKLANFLSQLKLWRDMSRQQPLVELIWQIYQDTGFLDYVGGLPAGLQRQANLHALYQRASSYEEMSFKGLFQFVRFIEKMQQKDKDLAEPTAVSEGESAVRVMTIHASKGLEFPVVFVLDLTRRFNLRDLRQDYIFDPKLGAGIKYTDPDSRLFYRTLPYLAIHGEKRKKLLAEEMRKLYVALTRAEEKLFLVGSYKTAEEAWKKWSSAALESRVVIDETIRLGAGSLMDWIGQTLIRHHGADEVQNEYEIARVGEIYHHPAKIKFGFSDLTTLRDESLKWVTNQVHSDQSASERQELTTNETTSYERIIQRLEYDYPFLSGTKTANYQAVSEIKRVFEDPDNQGLLSLDLSEGKATTVNRYVTEELAVPKFMRQESEASAVEVGTATHLILQLLPLTSIPTAEDLTDMIEDLVSRQVLTEPIGSKINVQSILAFFATEFGQQLLANPERVKREQPFSMLLPAESIFKDYPKNAQDEILVHGIIDGYFETADELVLYDFKTDHIANPTDLGEQARLKDKYRGQLTLYRQALEQVKQQSVTSIKLIVLNADLQLELLSE